MTVVADTGPLHYLVLLDLVDLIPRLVGPVLVPSVVRDELLHAEAPAMVRRWASSLPEWAVVAEAQATAAEYGLHAGEAAVLAIAVERRAKLVMMDDRAGRLMADRLGLPVIGTVGLLRRAAEEGRISWRDTLDRLRRTNFHMSAALLSTLERWTPEPPEVI